MACVSCQAAAKALILASKVPSDLQSSLYSMSYLTAVMQASGGTWNRDLLFNVPRDHEEVQRLEGRYKKYANLEAA